MEPGPSFSLPNAVFSPLGMPLLPTPFTLLSWEKKIPPFLNVAAFLGRPRELGYVVSTLLHPHSKPQPPQWPF